MSTPIDEFHDWTHTDAVEDVVKNSDLVMVLKALADAAVYIKNSDSNQKVRRGIYNFDISGIERHIEEALTFLNSTRRLRP